MSVPGRLYLLFTPAACRAEPVHTLAEAIAGGVDLVQWRDKPVRVPAQGAGVADDGLAERARGKRPGDDGHDASTFAAVRETCRRAGVPLLVDDDVMLAVRSRAHGAHVGQDDLPAEVARKLLVRGWLGVSTHDVAQIRAAAAAGADYVGFGPCHATATKGYTTGKTAAEIEAAVHAAAALRLPLFAIGGITPANLLPLRVLGIDRIAVSSSILGADDPRAAAAALRRML